MPDHKQKVVFLKKVPIDEEIIPIVRYLNSWKRVFTLYCCQGNKGGRSYLGAWGYVSFVVFDKKARKILKEFFGRYGSLHYGGLNECPHAITIYFRTYKDRQACVAKCQRQRKIDKENGYDW